jgi:antitoxin (DNA-binding transcriptional repressor) of toxin-antitoxin stability system
MAATTIDVHELPQRLHALLEEARAGAEIIVSMDNMPRARLVPLPENKPRVLGLNLGTVEMADDFDAPLPEDFWIATP